MVGRFAVDAFVGGGRPDCAVVGAGLGCNDDTRRVVDVVETWPKPSAPDVVEGGVRWVKL